MPMQLNVFNTIGVQIYPPAGTPSVYQDFINQVRVQFAPATTTNFSVSIGVTDDNEQEVFVYLKIRSSDLYITGAGSGLLNIKDISEEQQRYGGEGVDIHFKEPRILNIIRDVKKWAESSEKGKFEQSWLKNLSLIICEAARFQVISNLVNNHMDPASLIESIKWVNFQPVIQNWDKQGKRVNIDLETTRNFLISDATISIDKLNFFQESLNITPEQMEEAKTLRNSRPQVKTDLGSQAITLQKAETTKLFKSIQDVQKDLSVITTASVPEDSKRAFLSLENHLKNLENNLGEFSKNNSTTHQYQTLKSGTEGTTERATNAAVRGAKEVGMGFVDFTQGLITGTFSSVAKSNMEQMVAYAEMVANLAKSLNEVASQDISESAVTEKLFTIFGKKNESEEIEKLQITKSHLQQLRHIVPKQGTYFTDVLGAFGRTSEAIDKFIDNFQEQEITPEGIAAIKTAIKYGLAKNSINMLRQMARDGMTRIVVTEGEIRTKLTFSINSDETTARTTHTEDKTDAGGEAKVGAFWGWGNAKVEGHYNKLQVNQVDETSISNIKVSSEMIGEVKLKFKTDYLPLNNNTNLELIE